MTRKLIPHGDLRAVIRRRPRSQKVIAALALGCLLLAIGGDLATGVWLRGKISSIAGHRLHAHAEVSLGGGPALSDVINGRIPSAHVHANSATVCSITDVDLSATATNLHRVNASYAASSTHAQLTLEQASLTNLIAKRLPSATAQPDPADNTIDIHAGPDHLVTLALRPHLNHHRLKLTLTQATILGRALPATLTDRLQSQIDRAPTLSHLPLNLTARQVAVTNQGLRVNLSGGAWHASRDAPTQSCRATT